MSFGNIQQKETRKKVCKITKLKEQFTQIFNKDGCTDGKGNIQNGNEDMEIKASPLKKRTKLEEACK